MLGSYRRTLPSFSIYSSKLCCIGLNGRIGRPNLVWPRNNMIGVWVWEPAEATSVIFVHGVLSTGESCWSNSNGAYWPDLLKSEASLSDIGIYVFTYQTGFFSGMYRLGDVVDALKEHLRLDNVIGARRNLIFVCHSMGGIVVRKFLVERANDLIDQECRIGLFLLASPSLGSSYANWLAPLARFLQ